MAVGLTIDLKLDQPPDSFFDTVNFELIPHNSSIGAGTGAAISQAENLAYLGCYYLATRSVDTTRTNASVAIADHTKKHLVTLWTAKYSTLLVIHAIMC
jgi:hypothetical protein